MKADDINDQMSSLFQYWVYIETTRLFYGGAKVIHAVIFISQFAPKSSSLMANLLLIIKNYQQLHLLYVWTCLFLGYFLTVIKRYPILCMLFPSFSSSLPHFVFVRLLYLHLPLALLFPRKSTQSEPCPTHINKITANQTNWKSLLLHLLLLLLLPLATRCWITSILHLTHHPMNKVCIASTASGIDILINTWYM